MISCKAYLFILTTNVLNLPNTTCSYLSTGSEIKVYNCFPVSKYTNDLNTCGRQSIIFFLTMNDTNKKWNKLMSEWEMNLHERGKGFGACALVELNSRKSRIPRNSIKTSIVSSTDTILSAVRFELQIVIVVVSSSLVNWAIGRTRTTSY